MNNDYDETDMDGCALTAYLATLGFFCYACMTIGGTAGSWIAVFLGLAMLLGVAIYIRGRKKKRQEKKEKDKMEQYNRRQENTKVATTEISTRILLQQTLAKLSLNYDFDEDQNFVVEYQGETFIIRQIMIQNPFISTMDGGMRLLWMTLTTFPFCIKQLMNITYHPTTPELFTPRIRRHRKYISTYYVTSYGKVPFLT